jgi:hypothetical protein
MARTTAKVIKLPSTTRGTVTVKVGAKSGSSPSRQVQIKPPKFEVALVSIRGTAPYVQHRFPEKAVNMMIATQEAGHQARKGKRREAKDFDAVYSGAMYKSKQGWNGIPASSFRNAIISACRMVGFKMTLAKLSVFVEADGFDPRCGTPLVRITKGTPRRDLRPARNANGSADIRCRPMWTDGWEATVRLRWDADQFTADDVMNLMARVGAQVGIGEGRPDSKNSAGLGWGLFSISQ